MLPLLSSVASDLTNANAGELSIAVVWAGSELVAAVTLHPQCPANRRDFALGFVNHFPTAFRIHLQPCTGRHALEIQFNRLRGILVQREQRSEREDICQIRRAGVFAIMHLEFAHGSYDFIRQSPALQE